MANPRVILVNVAEEPERVGLVSGGGSGHEPAFLGYLGKGLLWCCRGRWSVFLTGTYAFLEAIRVADRGNGVARLLETMQVIPWTYRWHCGWQKMKGDMLPLLKSTWRHCLCTEKCRGQTTWYCWRCSDVKPPGRLLQVEDTRRRVIAVAEQTAQHTRSVCVGTAPCTIPAVESRHFIIDAGTYEFGIGHHGEAGQFVAPRITLIKLLNPWLLHYWMISTLKRDLNLP